MIARIFRSQARRSFVLWMCVDGVRSVAALALFWFARTPQVLKAVC
jgi:hypothetical protein